MQTNPEKIKKHFKKSINKYASHAVVQKMTAEKLSVEISGQAFESVLEIGSGAGLLTKNISQNCQFNKYLANDLVEESEIYVKEFIPNAKFVCGDFREIELQEKFNLIASNAVFQWFDNLESVLDKCFNLLNPQGLLVFSTFSPDNFKEFREITGLTLDYKSEEELIRFLETKFKIIKLEKFEHVMKFNSPLEILVHMKNTGVNSLSTTKWSISDIRNFCEEYLRKFSENTLTYSPIIVVAKLK